MFKTNNATWLLVSALASIFYLNTAWAGEDLKGSKDHPKIPRVADTTIIGYAQSSYDEGEFMTGATGDQLNSEKIEGNRTRIMYVGPEDLSPLGVLRNYQKAFADLGKVDEVYICKGNDCFLNLGGTFIWGEGRRIRNDFENLGSGIYAETDYYTNQIYWYARVNTSESIFHVSVYSAIRTGEHFNAFIDTAGLDPSKILKNKPLIHLEVIEVTDFKSSLEVVTANDMSKKISEKGHIALYGIKFDFDSDILKPESGPLLKEIAKALKADEALNIYVVGHTDNKGALEYNENLSKRRANAVVKKLSSEYGIESSRLTPAGVGPVAPIATNKTEEGRALNRRVELVER